MGKTNRGCFDMLHLSPEKYIRL